MYWIQYSRLEFIRAAYTKLSKRVSSIGHIYAYHYALLLFIHTTATRRLFGKTYLCKNDGPSARYS